MIMAEPQKVVGVLGGMGPEAAIEFLRRLIVKTDVTGDTDHIHILLDNNSKIPSRVEHILEGSCNDPTPVLQAMARGLHMQGADVLVMPCNTAHYYIDAVIDSVDIPVLNMIDVCIETLKVRISAPATVAIFGTPVIREAKLYEERMEAHGYQSVFPSRRDEERLHEVIKAIKAGRFDSKSAETYSEIVEVTCKEGVNAIILACTELSLLPRLNAAPLCVDALDALAIATIGFANGDGGS